MRRLSRPDFDSRGWRDGRVRDLQTRASGMDRPLSKEQGGTCWLEVMRCNKSACPSGRIIDGRDDEAYILK
jgi:hypothetical protein